MFTAPPPTNHRFNSFSNDTLDELSEMSQSISFAKPASSGVSTSTRQGGGWKQHQQDLQQDDDEFTPSFSSKLFISQQKESHDALLEIGTAGLADDDAYSRQSQGHAPPIQRAWSNDMDLHSVNLDSDPRQTESMQRSIQDGGLYHVANPLTSNPQHKSRAGQQENEFIISALLQHHDRTLNSKTPDQVIHVLSQKLKQVVASATKSALFIKKRSALEAEYAHSGSGVGAGDLSNNHFVNLLNSLSSHGRDAASVVKGVAATPSTTINSLWESGVPGGFNSQWEKIVNVHRNQDETRFEFAKSMGIVAENISLLAKNTERSRKQLKESAAKQLKILQEAETELEKSRSRFEMATIEWERSNGKDTDTMSTYSSTHKSSNGFQNFSNKLKKHFKTRLSEEEIRAKVSSTNTCYKNALSHATSVRKTYHSHHIPRLVESLVTVLGDCQEGLVRYIDMYARLVEDGIVAQGEIVAPVVQAEKGGLLNLVNGIDFQKEMESFVDIYCSGAEMEAETRTIRQIVKGGEMVRSSSVVASGVYFGSRLDDIMARDGNQAVPLLVINCTDYIEETGLLVDGIYRAAPSQSSRIDALRSIIDVQPTVALEDVVADIHAVTGVLKLFFRELEEYLVPASLYASFVDAARGDDDRQCLIRVHEQVNGLSDASYATLKHMAVHLSNVSSHQDVNHMSIENLAKIWAPILMDSGVDSRKDDIFYACKALEIIIRNVHNIFEI